jgi:transcriptional regulator with XRE-family HTH domain
MRADLTATPTQQMKRTGKFRKWLYQNGMSIKDLCLIIGIDRSQIWRWTSGASQPDVHSMKRVRLITKGAFTKPEDLLDDKP